MHTVLDDAHTWFLHAVAYQDELRVILAEGFVSEETEDLCVGGYVIKGTRALDTRDGSRLFAVRFPQFIAWQVVDESYTPFDEYEQRNDTGTVQILSRLMYFDYVKRSHGWFEDIIGPALRGRVQHGPLPGDPTAVRVLPPSRAWLSQFTLP